MGFILCDQRPDIMMKHRLSYILAAIMLTFSLTVKAQQDTLSLAADSLQAGGRSILGLKMQKRYTPVNRPFLEDRKLFANSFLMLVGSGYRQLEDNYSNGPYLTAVAGKWLKPAHGVRLSMGAGYFFDNYDYRRIKMIDVRADYMFNLSAYVDGYNPYRMLEVHMLAGLGYELNWQARNAPKTGPSVHLGADLSMRVFPGVDLVLEPLFELQKDSRRLARMDVWRGYIPAFHGGVGARLYLDRRNWGEDPGADWFFTVSGGFQRQNSELGHRIEFSDAIGGSFFMGAGRYYNEMLSVRLQAGYGWHYWKEIVEGDTDIYGNLLDPGRFLSSYYVCRMDVLVNLLPLIWKDQDRFSVAVMAGPEVGLLNKKDPYRKDIVYPYVGASAGIQAKCRIAGGLSVFIEPRASYVPYSAYAFSTSTENKNYYDAVMSLSLGFEYRLGEK